MTGVLLSVFVVGAVLLALLVDVAVAVGWLNNRLKIKLFGASRDLANRDGPHLTTVDVRSTEGLSAFIVTPITC
jgi:hypothetical protein